MTEGIIYRVPMKAIDYLYKREGVHSNGYRPAIVSVVSDHQHYEVLTFIGVDAQPEIPPTNHYATEIMRGASGILSESYMAQLKGKIAILTQINS